MSGARSGKSRAKYEKEESEDEYTVGSEEEDDDDDLQEGGETVRWRGERGGPGASQPLPAHPVTSCDVWAGRPGAVNRRA